MVYGGIYQYKSVIPVHTGIYRDILRCTKSSGLVQVVEIPDDLADSVDTDIDRRNWAELESDRASDSASPGQAGGLRPVTDIMIMIDSEVGHQRSSDLSGVQV